LETVENLPTPVAHDLAQPDTAVDRDEKSALMQPSGLSMSDNIGVEQMVPYLRNLSFALAAVQAQLFQHAWHQSADGLTAQSLRFLKGSQIDATPLGQNTLAGSDFPRAF
jgi:hypothetical protein